MKKKLMMTAMILLIVEVIALFVPLVYVEENFVPEKDYYTTYSSYLGLQVHETEVWTHRYDEHVNVIFVDDSFAPILGIVLIAATAVAAAVMLLAVLGKLKETSKWIIIAPIISAVLLVLDAIYVCGGFADGDTSARHLYWKFDWVFFVIAALSALSLVFAVLIKVKKEKDTDAPQTAQVAPVQEEPAQTSVSEGTSSINTAQELKQFKDLLDSGIITQEEFDAKKKQLLGL